MPEPVFTKKPEKGKDAGRLQGRTPRPDERYRPGDPHPAGNQAVARALEQISRAANQLGYQLEAAKERHDVQEKINRDQWAVSWFSEQVGSVAGVFQGKGLRSLNIPEKTIWNTSEHLLKEVRHWLAAGDVIRAAHALQNLADEFTKANKELNEYLEGIIGGAEISTTGLKVAAAAGAIAASIATGGAAAGAGLTIAGTSAAIGVGAGTYGLVQETATQTGEMFAGSRKDFDFDAILLRGGKDAINGFVGAFTGGVFTKYAARYFGRIAISRMSKDQIADLAERLGVDVIDMTPQVFLSKGQQFLIEFFAGGVATTPITTAVEVTLNNLTGQTSQESFIKTVIDNAFTEGLLQLFLGLLTRGKAKPGKGRKPASLPKASDKMPLQSHQKRTAEVQAHTKSSLTPSKETVARTESIPDAPAEIQLQSPQEWLAETQVQTKSSFASPRESTFNSGSLSDAPAEISLQTSQEASQQWTALKQLEAGTPKPGPGKPEIELKPAPGFRKSGSKKGAAKGTSRKAVLEQTGPATKKKVAVGSLIKSGIVETTAYKSYKLSGKQRYPGREEQLYDLRDQKGWKAHRKNSDAFRRKNAQSLSKGGLKVNEPDPAFPGETVKSINEDHIVPIRKIRDLPGFARLDSETAKFEIENMPENLELVSEKLNKSRGDLSYEEWAKSETGRKADPAFLAQQIAKEKQIMSIIQARIDELLRLQMTREWRLRLGMPSWSIDPGKSGLANVPKDIDATVEYIQHAAPAAGKTPPPPVKPLTQRDLMTLFVKQYKVPVPSLEFYQGYRTFAEYEAAFLRRSPGYKGPVPRGWFDPLTKFIHFPPGANVHTKIHETLHWYGAKNRVGMNLGSFMNEGLTDWLVRKQLGERAGKHAYDAHVRFVRELAGHVGEAPLMMAFLHGRWDYFHRAMYKQAGSLNNAQRAYFLLARISADGKGMEYMAEVRRLLRMKAAKPIPKGPKPPGKPKTGHTV